MWTTTNGNNSSSNNIGSGMMTGNDEININSIPRQNSATPANGSASTAAAIAVVDGGEELQALVDEMSKN